MVVNLPIGRPVPICLVVLLSVLKRTTTTSGGLLATAQGSFRWVLSFSTGAVLQFGQMGFLKNRDPLRRLVSSCFPRKTIPKEFPQLGETLIYICGSASVTCKVLKPQVEEVLKNSGSDAALGDLMMNQATRGCLSNCPTVVGFLFFLPITTDQKGVHHFRNAHISWCEHTGPHSCTSPVHQLGSEFIVYAPPRSLTFPTVGHRVYDKYIYIYYV